MDWALAPRTVEKQTEANTEAHAGFRVLLSTRKTDQFLTQDYYR